MLRLASMELSKTAVKVTQQFIARKNDDPSCTRPMIVGWKLFWYVALEGDEVLFEFEGTDYRVGHQTFLASTARPSSVAANS